MIVDQYAVEFVKIENEDKLLQRSIHGIAQKYSFEVPNIDRVYMTLSEAGGSRIRRPIIEARALGFYNRAPVIGYGYGSKPDASFDLALRNLARKISKLETLAQDNYWGV